MSGATLRAPVAVPWPVSPWAACGLCRPARGIDASLRGAARFRVLAHRALDECLEGRGPKPGAPLIVASCNGCADGFDEANWRAAFDTTALLAGTPWTDRPVPVVSASCASGLQALFLAARLLEAGHEDVVVLAADILSPANHDNFEALRVLTPEPTLPWQSTSEGFISGEAAVALLLTQNDTADAMTLIDGPRLSQDVAERDGLRQALGSVAHPRPALVIGQGTGPASVDAAELDALRGSIASDVPLTTPLWHFGHTNGASGLLSVALAALARRDATLPPALSMPTDAATDGRPLARKAIIDDDIVVACRALGGACAATRITRNASPRTPSTNTWQSTGEVGPLMHPLLRQIAADAVAHRPVAPPDVLVVRLETPLMPPPNAQIGGRLLPSAILEITPGFVAQLIARRWGFTGAALCLVGDARIDAAAMQLIQACQESGLTVSLVALHRHGDHYQVNWNG